MKNNQPVTQREIDYGDHVALVSKTDLQGIITYVNDSFVRISGFSREELIGKNHNIVRHPDMPSWAFEDLWKTVKNGHPWRGFVKNRAKNGDHYWVRATVSPITHKGEITGYLSLRKKPTKSEIAQAESLYRNPDPPRKRFSPLQWFGNLSLQLKIQPILLIVLVGATFAVYYEMRSSIMENVQKRAESTAMQVIDSANMLMVTGMISDPNNRRLMIKKIIEGQHLKSLRLVRTEQVVRQFGAGLPEEHLDDPKVRETIESSVKAGRPIPSYSLDHVDGKPVFRAITPYIESHDFHETDCLMCHQVKVGSSNGASDISIDLSREFGHLDRIIVYLAAGQLALQIFLYFFLGWIARRFVADPVEEIKQHLEEIVEGDFSRQVDISKRDEMGELLCSIQSTKVLMGSVIDQIGSVSSEIEKRSLHLSEASFQASQAAQAQSEASHNMASGMEQISVSIDHVSENTDEVRKITVESSSIASSGGETVRQVVSDMISIGTEVVHASESIKNLGEKSEEIKGIVQVIRDIADQTNLLALNAAIEAARAGEQGRGFAVVADEVRKLAEKTSSSTQEIAMTISGIHDGTMDAIRMIGTVVEKVKHGEKLAGAAGEAILAIGEGAQKVKVGVDDISSSIREQSIASREVAANVERIAQMSEENTEVIAQVDDTAKALKELVSTLEATVGNFRM